MANVLSTASTNRKKGRKKRKVSLTTTINTNSWGILTSTNRKHNTITYTARRCIWLVKLLASQIGKDFLMKHSWKNLPICVSLLGYWMNIM